MSKLKYFEILSDFKEFIEHSPHEPILLDVLNLVISQKIQIDNLQNEIENNYRIRREASAMLKNVEEKLPMCYEEQRAIGIIQLFEKAEEFAEVVFGDVAVRLSDLKAIKNEMAGDK